MRYSLRTLLIVMLLGGPALAVAWWAHSDLNPREEVSVVRYKFGNVEFGTEIQ